MMDQKRLFFTGPRSSDLFNDVSGAIPSHITRFTNCPVHIPIGGPKKNDLFMTAIMRLTTHYNTPAPTGRFLRSGVIYCQMRSHR